MALIRPYRPSLCAICGALYRAEPGYAGDRCRAHRDPTPMRAVIKIRARAIGGKAKTASVKREFEKTVVVRATKAESSRPVRRRAEPKAKAPRPEPAPRGRPELPYQERLARRIGIVTAQERFIHTPKERTYGEARKRPPTGEMAKAVQRYAERNGMQFEDAARLWGYNV